MNPIEKIARVNLEPKVMRMKHITLYERRLRFKCKRCATFCCKLGGPTLSLKDVERLKKTGRSKAEFLDTIQSSLRNEASGSCVFLEYDKEKGVYACAVYQHRPALCRLYPFYFQKISPNLFILKIMPCRGISHGVGEPVDKRFFVNHLFDFLHEFVCAKFY